MFGFCSLCSPAFADTDKVIVWGQPAKTSKIGKIRIKANIPVLVPINLPATGLTGPPIYSVVGTVSSQTFVTPSFFDVSNPSFVGNSASVVSPLLSCLQTFAGIGYPRPCKSRYALKEGLETILWTDLNVLRIKKVLSGRQGNSQHSKITLDLAGFQYATRDGKCLSILI